MTKPANFEVYFDFDNTVTPFDVLDDIIQKFSINEDWRKWEAEWEAGRIGSRECIEREMGAVRVTEARLAEYLGTVPIDPAFAPVVALLRERGIEPSIVSDSFSSIIGRILANHGLEGLPVRANELVLEGDRPRVSFPYFNSICSVSGNCKCSHLHRRGRPAGRRKIYVGDGRSDICPAGFCEILFAKGRLFEHYSSSHRDCTRFQDLSSVHAKLKELLK